MSRRLAVLVACLAVLVLGAALPSNARAEPDTATERTYDTGLTVPVPRTEGWGER